MNLFWTLKEMAKGSKAPYQQSDHFDLPVDDKIIPIKERVEAIYKQNKSLIKTIAKVCYKEAILTFILSVLINLFSQSSPYVLGLLVTRLTNGQTTTKEDKIWLVCLSGYLVLSAYIGGVLLNFCNFISFRTGLRLSNSLSMMVFEKITRYNIMNRSEHSPGTILNHVQTDAESFYLGLPRIVMLTSTFFQMSFAIIVLYTQIGWLSWIVISIYVVGMLLMTIFYSFKMGCTDNLMAAKDARVLTLTNVINNIKFIKIKGWENFFHYKVFTKRKIELGYLFQLVLYSSFELFFIFLNHSTAQMALILFMVYFAPQEINVAAITVCLSLMWSLFDAIIQVPWNIGRFLDFKVGLNRIHSFLQAEEIDKSHFIEDASAMEDYGLLVKSGEFYWNAVRDEDEREERRRTRALEASQNDTNGSLLESFEENYVDKGFMLSDIRFKAEKGKLVMIIGKIGCGKSSLLYALVGEMKRAMDIPTEIHACKSISFLSETPWFLGSTIKDNILLDKPYDEEQFKKALRLSQLADDVKELPNGVDTFIGENGQTVSGGQRTRIALARCIYQDNDMMILDDPLSALDLKVADRIMSEAICGELSHKTRIIATHAIHNLKYADHIYILDHGKVVFEGSYQEVQQSSIYNEFKQVTEDYVMEEYEDPEEETPTNPEVRKTTVHVPRRKTSMADAFQEVALKNKELTGDLGKSGLDRSILERESIKAEQNNTLLDKMFMEEDKVQGKLGFSTILVFLQEMGGILPVFLAVTAVATLAYINFLSDFYHLEWSGSFDIDDKFDYLWFLAFLLGSRCVVTFLRVLINFSSLMLMSKKIHARMMFRVLHAKIGEFLERVPAGRIINRFTKDIDIIDRELGWPVDGFYNDFATVAMNIVVLIWSVGYVLAGPISLFLISGIYYQRKFMNTKREVVRLESISRSPVMTCVTGILRGAPEIRVMHKIPFVTKEFTQKIEDFQKNSLLICGLDYWYMNQINILNILFIQIPGFAIIFYSLYVSNQPYPIQKLIFFVMKSVEISASLSNLLMNLSYLESYLVSVERCSSFSKIEPEARYLNFKIHERKYLHPKSKDTIIRIMKDIERNERAIISQGKVIFHKVSARYPTKPVPVLCDLNLNVKPGEKIGIVGRTGAGKTSLIKLFWMCLEPSEGTVYVDGRDVTKIDLKVLRSNLDIISQETAIFEGTLRENLDPKLEYLYDKNSQEFKKKDRELLNKLFEIGFKEEHLDGKGLDFMISAGGDNLSLGQKQLLCFMRVLINPKKLMILDEATANIDLKTEKLMQDAVGHEFKNSTMFIIAHRIQTVLECDKICIMEYGKIVEYGTPKELIRRPGSKFGEIYKKLKENMSIE
jgi:ATP-binding cassette subfamily C (CFTR/MRP) protein 1